MAHYLKSVVFERYDSKKADKFIFKKDNLKKKEQYHQVKMTSILIMPKKSSLLNKLNFVGDHEDPNASSTSINSNKY